jgi:hypothetical protein
MYRLIFCIAVQHSVRHLIFATALGVFGSLLTILSVEPWAIELPRRSAATVASPELIVDVEIAAA